MGNISTADEDDDDGSSAGGPTPNGIPGHRSDARSVSSSLHDRKRGANPSGASNGVAVPSASSTPPITQHKHSHHKTRSSSHGGATSGPTGSSPTNSRENTFLTYFFGGGGGNGQLPQGGFGAAPPAAIFGSKVGRDSIGKEYAPSAEAGRESPALATLNAPSGRGMEQGNAALDMKSLSKHIEAVRQSCKSDLSSRQLIPVSAYRSPVTPLG